MQPSKLRARSGALRSVPHIVWVTLPNPFSGQLLSCSVLDLLGFICVPSLS